MGFYIGAHRGVNGRPIEVERVGTCGSERAWMAVLFAGYGAGEFPEAERVRHWVEPYGVYWTDIQRAEHPNLPYRFAETHLLKDLRALIAYNDRDCSYIDLTYYRFGHQYQGGTPVSRSLAAKPATCPTLLGLVAIYEMLGFRHTKTAGKGVKLSGKRLKLALQAQTNVLRYLQKSCWLSKVIRLRRIFVIAARNGGYVDGD